MTGNNTLETLLTERDVAGLLKVSIATIRRRRLLGQPPAWIKVGASVRYSPSELAGFVESRRIGGGCRQLVGDNWAMIVKRVLLGIIIVVVVLAFVVHRSPQAAGRMHIFPHEKARTLGER